MEREEPKLNSERTIPWPRILAEGTVIVVSILLAFSIDAWWDGRQQRHNETVLLQALLDDLIEKRERLAFRIKYNEGILDAAQALINTDAQDPLEPAEVDRLIGFTWWYNDPTDWDSAPMRSLLMGGELSSVSNPVLLQKLSELQLMLGGIRNVAENDERFHLNVLIPFYIEHISLPEIANASNHLPGHPDRPYPFPEFTLSSPHDNSAILASREFRSLLVAKMDNLVDMARDYETFDAQLNDSIAMIRAELAK